MSLHRMVAVVAVLFLALPAPRVHAELDQATKGSEVSMLQDAYVLLSQANHDYDGHRVKAMQSIHKAGLLLKVNIQSNGDVHEDQGASDTQLQKAQKVLQQARSFAAGKRQRKLVKHLDAAISHLSAALGTK